MGLFERLKKKQHEKEVPSYVIETELDKLYNLVSRVGSVSLGEASSQLNIPLKRVEQWAHLMEKEGLLSLEYPAVGQPRISRAERKEKQQKKIEHKSRNLLIFAGVVSLAIIILLILLRRGIISLQ
jgi:hypothetical protein